MRLHGKNGGLVLAAIGVASAHLLVLGSLHDHDLDRSVHVSSMHECFLCQVSPNVCAELDLEYGAIEQLLVAAPECSAHEAPSSPFLCSGTARSPPL